MNLFIPWNAKMEVTPFYIWNGLMRVPFCFEADVHCMMLENGQCTGWDASALMNVEGIKVFNFHPIHLFLNTEKLSRYESTRQFHKDASILCKYRYDGEGSMLILKNVIREAKQRKMNFKNVKDIRI